MPNLVEWIKKEFPEKEITFRGLTMRFRADILIDEMQDLDGLEGIQYTKIMLQKMSIEPYLTDEALAIMPKDMLMGIYYLLFPKKEPTSLPPENTKPVSSAVN